MLWLKDACFGGRLPLQRMIKQMMKYLIVIAAAFFALQGCNQTDSESETLGDKVGAAVEGAVEATADFTTDATMSATVTPAIKSAIIADPELNDPHNTIDVSCKDRTVYLNGHVANAQMKARAQEIAEGWLKKSAAPDDVKIVNELESH
jgi:osmotically-inducible protein OsmY